jgi:hypothetical protein
MHKLFYIITILLFIATGCSKEKEIIYIDQKIIYHFGELPSYIKSIENVNGNLKINFISPIIDLRNGIASSDKPIESAILKKEEVLPIPGVSFGDPLKFIDFKNGCGVLEFRNGRDSNVEIFIKEYEK